MRFSCDGRKVQKVSHIVIVCFNPFHNIITELLSHVIYRMLSSALRYVVTNNCALWLLVYSVVLNAVLIGVSSNVKRYNYEQLIGNDASEKSSG